MLETGYFLYKPAAWLSVRGEDAPGFLQGQFSNQLESKNAQLCTYGLWLDRRGRVQADGFVLLIGDTHHIFSYDSPVAGLVERLNTYIIADDVDLADETDKVKVISLIGDEAVSILGQLVGLPAPGEVKVIDRGILFAGRRTDGPNFEWVMTVDAVTGVQAQLHQAGLKEYRRDQLDRLRIRSGIPMVPMEIGSGDLPQEGGLEREAVSFTKGCYLGQEVMARLQATGRIRRRLIAVRVEEPSSVPGPLFRGSEQVGELRTVVGVGLDGPNGVAMVKIDAARQAATGLSLVPDGPVRVQMMAHMGGDSR